MWQNLFGASLIAALTTCVAGCSLVQPAAQSVSNADYRPQPGGQPEMTFDVILFNEQGPLPKIDPQDLQPGQHVRLITGETPSCDDRDIHAEVLMFSRSFAGTVKANDSERLVLQDVVLINEARQTGVPVVSRVPYFSRLFKNTSVARPGVSIPGEVALERSKILHACQLTDDSFKNIRQNGGYERIGVDFDFNVADRITPTQHGCDTATVKQLSAIDGNQ
jgi:hypothetical protein